MAHKSQMDFVATIRDRYPAFFQNKLVLEVGSLDINGSIRSFFTGCDYIGVDIGPGEGVDLVAPAHELKLPDGHFDVCCSCECFEHDKHWRETFTNMIRMSRGLVFFTCAHEGRREHGTMRTTPADSPYTTDYYRNLTRSDFGFIKFEDHFSDWGFKVNDMPQDLYFWGIRWKPSLSVR